MSDHELIPVEVGDFVTLLSDKDKQLFKVTKVYGGFFDCVDRFGTTYGGTQRHEIDDLLLESEAFDAFHNVGYLESGQ